MYCTNTIYSNCILKIKIERNKSMNNYIAFKSPRSKEIIVNEILKPYVGEFSTDNASKNVTFVNFNNLLNKNTRLEINNLYFLISIFKNRSKDLIDLLSLYGMSYAIVYYDYENDNYWIRSCIGNIRVENREIISVGTGIFKDIQDMNCFNEYFKSKYDTYIRDSDFDMLYAESLV